MQAVDPQAERLNQQAAILANQGELARATGLFRQALELAPQVPALRVNLARALLGQQQIEAGLEQFEQAIQIDPARRETLDSAARAYHQNGQTAALITLLQGLIKSGIDTPLLHLQTAAALLREGRADEAGPHAQQALNLAPRDISLRLELARMAVDAQVPSTAALILNSALEIEPDNTEVLYRCADALVKAGRLPEAQACVQKLLASQPNDARCLIAQARIKLARQQALEAEEDLKKAMKLDPNSEAQAELARLYQITGRRAQSMNLLDEELPESATGLHNRIISQGFCIDAQLEETVRQQLASRQLGNNNQYALSSALALVYERRGEHARAFAQMQQAQSIPARLHPYNKQSFSSLIDSIIEVFSSEMIDRLADCGNPSQRPVFIVGMPRSGTSLLEQVLAAHPDVFPAGELNFVVDSLRIVSNTDHYPDCVAHANASYINAVAEDYLRRIDSLDASAARLSDKLPHNFLRLGLIALMFPAASIVHLKRDSRDVALSNYFARFGLRNDLLSYHSSLDGIAHHIAEYRRLMAHWNRVLPNRILELSYEQLVGDLHAQAGSLLETIGLGWTDRIMEFHTLNRPVDTASAGQVNQPLYQSSIGRWEKYRDQMETVLDALETAQVPP